ncbi:MAG: hypothetical protein N2690_11885, partial [Rhodocyclaceae bacterium]|nr:hypothetical protein [Rhodocyclaceae bacterium]
MSTPMSAVSTPGRRPLMTLEEALQRLLQAVQPLPLTVERVPLEEADARVLAEDVVAALDVPGFDNS